MVVDAKEVLTNRLSDLSIDAADLSTPANISAVLKAVVEQIDSLGDEGAPKGGRVGPVAFAKSRGYTGTDPRDHLALLCESPEAGSAC